jgi:hypothetical protein
MTAAFLIAGTLTVAIVKSAFLRLLFFKKATNKNA